MTSHNTAKNKTAKEAPAGPARATVESWNRESVLAVETSAAYPNNTALQFSCLQCQCALVSLTPGRCVHVDITYR